MDNKIDDILALSYNTQITYKRKVKGTVSRAAKKLRDDDRCAEVRRAIQQWYYGVEHE